MRANNAPAAADHGESGMSMIELMFGSFLTILVLGSIITVNVQNSKLSSHDRELNLAFTTATNNLEQLRGIPFADLPAMDGVGFDVPGLDGSIGGLSAVPGDEDGLPGRFSVTLDRDVGGKTLYVVKATVDWQGAHDVQHLEFVTLIGDRVETTADTGGGGSGSTTKGSGSTTGTSQVGGSTK